MNRVAILALSLAACGGAASTADLESRLAQSERNFDKLVELLQQSRALPPPAPDAAVTYAVPVAATDPVEGSSSAPVTIIEAYEFLCPYCAKAHPTVESLSLKYGNDVRVVSKYMVIHGMAAVPPGLIACAANKRGKFAEAKRALWTAIFDEDLQQIEENLEQDKLLAIVSQATGIDVATLASDAGFTSDDSTCMTWIKDSMETMEAFSVSGTPGFFINGRFLGGAYPQADFDKLIDEELAKAKAAIAKGVPAAEYYQREIVGKGSTEVAPAFPVASE